jgi:hypothetical protein
MAENVDRHAIIVSKQSVSLPATPAGYATATRGLFVGTSLFRASVDVETDLVGDVSPDASSESKICVVVVMRGPTSGVRQLRPMTAGRHRPGEAPGRSRRTRRPCLTGGNRWIKVAIGASELRCAAVRKGC